MCFSEKVYFLIILITLTVLEFNTAADINEQQDAKCSLPMEPGPCRMSLNRFYYNAKTDTCEEFKFGGCRGNDNKFGFKQTCEAACRKSQSASTSKPTAISSTTATPNYIAKQLKSDTLKTLATSNADSSGTTPKPQATGTTVKTQTSTARSGRTTTATQRLKRF